MEDIYYYKDGTTSEDLDSSKILHRLDGPAIEVVSQNAGLRMVLGIVVTVKRLFIKQVKKNGG